MESVLKGVSIREHTLNKFRNVLQKEILIKFPRKFRNELTQKFQKNLTKEFERICLKHFQRNTQRKFQRN